MSWDTSACFKSMCTAFSDFQRQRSDQTVQDLQRQIDVILGVTSHGATLNDFTPKQLIYAETLSALVSLVNESNLKTSLYLKSFMALSQLANDHETKTSLQNDFNLASSVVGFILGHSVNTTNKQMILQALLLLEKMTYGSRCNINNIYMVDLLKYLVKSIYTTASEFCMPSLAVLANLCRNNGNVRSFIKTMADTKQFVKVLLSYLSNSNKTFSITSLSIMASLYLNEALGDNMFNGQNLINMIRLAFKVLTSNDDVATRHYSIDLIIDFVKCDKTLKIINENGMLESDIFKIINLLHSTDTKTAVKIFELLIEFCQKPNLRRKVTYVFFKEVQANADTQATDQVIFAPAQTLLQWIAREECEDIVIQANVLSLILLKELFAETISSDSLNHITGYISQVLLILIPYIKIDVDHLEDTKQIKQKFRKLTAVFEVFSSLCYDDGMKKVLVGQLDPEVIFNIITSVLDKYSEDLNLLRDPAMSCCKEITLLVFRGLELMAGLKHYLEAGLVRYVAIIQNTKLIPFISHGLASKSKFNVHASLQVISEGLKVKEFQSKALADTLLLHNTSRENDFVTSPIKQNEQAVSSLSTPLCDITNTVKRNLNQDSATITMLTERLKKGLDMKDTKLSDIMDFYEHKLSALMGRESHIQDLLDTKSTTLAQTERLLAQYRCRHAQSDAECLKLRSMLQTSERKCETDSIKINEYMKTKQKLEDDVLSLHNQVKTLQSVAAEHEELKKVFGEQTQKLESVQKSLLAAEEEHNSLVSMNDCLLKNTDMLKTKLDGANERIREMEEEKQNLLGQLKEKEKEIGNLKKSLTDSKNKATSLEANIQELEASISEKENVVSQLHVELEKQCQISAMIHNLTMGKMNIPNVSTNTSK